jgi:hypothetical protein
VAERLRPCVRTRARSGRPGSCPIRLRSAYRQRSIGTLPKRLREASASEAAAPCPPSRRGRPNGPERAGPVGYRNRFTPLVRRICRQNRAFARGTPASRYGSAIGRMTPKNSEVDRRVALPWRVGCNSFPPANRDLVHDRSEFWHPTGQRARRLRLPSGFPRQQDSGNARRVRGLVRSGSDGGRSVDLHTAASRSGFRTVVLQRRRGCVLVVGDVITPGRGVPFWSTSSIAMCVMKRLGAAPCQCSSPGSKKTRSPGRMISSGPPRRSHRPTPSSTEVVFPFGCVCQAVRAPGVKWTLLAP